MLGGEERVVELGVPELLLTQGSDGQRRDRGRRPRAACPSGGS